MKTAQELKEDNAIQNRIAQGIADIRIAKVKSLTNSYKTGNITANEFLQMTDNLLQDELKQACGRY
jgi:hypothetical protein